MASGKVHVYTTAVKHIVVGTIDLEGDKIYAVPLTDGYTPGTASHSAFNQVSAFQATASATIVNAIQLSSVALTGSGATAIKLDAADIAGFSADGSTITSFKYLALVAQTQTAAAKLIGFIDLNIDSSDDSVGGSTQVDVAWPSGGVIKFNSNP